MTPSCSLAFLKKHHDRLPSWCESTTFYTSYRDLPSPLAGPNTASPLYTCSCHEDNNITRLQIQPPSFTEIPTKRPPSLISRRPSPFGFFTRLLRIILRKSHLLRTQPKLPGQLSQEMHRVVSRLKELVQVRTDVVVGQRHHVVAENPWSERDLRQQIHLAKKRGHTWIVKAVRHTRMNDACTKALCSLLLCPTPE